VTVALISDVGVLPQPDRMIVEIRAGAMMSRMDFFTY